MARLGTRINKNDLNEWYEKSCLLSPNIHSVKLQMFFDNKLVGVVNTKQRYPEDKHIEIGYWLASFANGKGVVTRCAKTLIDLCFELPDTPYIEIACDEANTKFSSCEPIRFFFKSRSDKNTTSSC